MRADAPAAPEGAPVAGQEGVAAVLNIIAGGMHTGAAPHNRGVCRPNCLSRDGPPYGLAP